MQDNLNDWLGEHIWVWWLCLALLLMTAGVITRGRPLIASASGPLVAAAVAGVAGASLEVSAAVGGVVAAVLAMGAALGGPTRAGATRDGAVMRGNSDGKGSARRSVE